MKAILAIAAAVTIGATPAVAAEQRCGWLSNPATGKWDLHDAHGTWQIMFLGGDGSRAEGMEKIPDLAAGEYVRTFATKGYACVCMSVDSDAETITRIHSVRQLPLSRCRADRAIQYFLDAG